MKKWFISLIILCSSLQVYAQDREYVPDKRNFSNYYFSPLKISRDHPLHASLFQIPLLSAQSLQIDTGVLGSSFEYSSIQSKYKNDAFAYEFEGGIYRLNFDFDFSLREDLDLLIRYDVAGVDGNKFTAVDGSNILSNDLKKSGSGNIDVIAKQKVYTLEGTGIDIGVALGCSIPIVNTKTLAVSKGFDFGGGVLATYRQDLYAIHFNLGFVYFKDSTAFTKSADFNYSVYSGISVVGKVLNKWYVIGQVTAQNPALKNELSPGNFVGDFDIGTRYVYNSYISEVWVGHGIGVASHGVNVGFSLSLSY